MVDFSFMQAPFGFNADMLNSVSIIFRGDKEREWLFKCNSFVGRVGCLLIRGSVVLIPCNSTLMAKVLLGKTFKKKKFKALSLVYESVCVIAIPDEAVICVEASSVSLRMGV